MNDEATLVDTNLAASLIGYAPGYMRQLRMVGGAPPFITMANKQIRYDMADLSAYAQLLGRKLNHQPLVEITE